MRRDGLQKRHDRAGRLAPERSPLGLEKHPGKERMGGELRAADGPGIVPNREPEARSLESRTEGGIEAEAAVVALA
jgi:hypothetical protein